MRGPAPPTLAQLQTQGEPRHARPSYHFPDVGEEPVSKVLCGFDGKLSGKVVDGAHEDPVSLHAAKTTSRVGADRTDPSWLAPPITSLHNKSIPVVIDVLVGVVHAERLVDGGALVHELDGASGVCRDVADGQQSAERK